jgi:phage pi2 protein 07
MQGSIPDFLDQNPRNKIVISKSELPDLQYLNIGEELAMILKDKSLTRRLSLIAETEIQKLIDKNVISNPALGKLIAIKNPGILLEPELKFNLLSFLENFSRDILIVMCWPGEIREKTLFFLSENKGIKINLDHLSLLRL